MHVVVDLATDPAGAFPGHKDASSRAAAADALAYRLVDALLSDTSELYRGRIGATVDPTQGDKGQLLDEPRVCPLASDEP